MISEIENLVRQAQSGSNEAFDKLYDMFAHRLFRFITYKVGDIEQAQDILQETFTKAWQALPNLPGENLQFSAWLYKIAANAINDFFRKQYRRPQTVELDESLAATFMAGADDQALVDADRQMVVKAMAQLPPRYRQVLELRFVEAFSVKETAQILNENYVTVRVLQYRALKKLKNILDQHDAMEYQKI